MHVAAVNGDLVKSGKQSCGSASVGTSFENLNANLMLIK
jgi:hypothetical protein